MVKPNVTGKTLDIAPTFYSAVQICILALTKGNGNAQAIAKAELANYGDKLDSAAVLIGALGEFVPWFKEFNGREVMTELDENCPQWIALKAALNKFVNKGGDDDGPY